MVTGLDADGTSRYSRIELVEPDHRPAAAPWGGRHFAVWRVDRLPAVLPTDGCVPPVESARAGEDALEALRTTGDCPPLGFRASLTLFDEASPPAPPAGWRDVVDIKFVAAGGFNLVGDADERTGIRAGDVVIVNGTRHRPDAVAPGTVVGTVTVGGIRITPPPARGPLPPAASGRGTPTSSDVLTPRRIVTGLADDGRSIVARADAFASGGGMFPIWGSDRLPILLPTDGRAPDFDSLPAAHEASEALARMALMPPPLGFRVTVNHLRATPEPLAMHYHDSVDVVFVLRGEVSHALDGGEDVLLRPGDCMIQNGTNHRWHCRAGETWLGIVSLGGVRFGAAPRETDRHAISRPPGTRVGERR